MKASDVRQNDRLLKNDVESRAAARRRRGMGERPWGYVGNGR
jgi:hypothetical protein